MIVELGPLVIRPLRDQMLVSGWKFQFEFKFNRFRIGMASLKKQRNNLTLKLRNKILKLELQEVHAIPRSVRFVVLQKFRSPKFRI